MKHTNRTKKFLLVSRILLLLIAAVWLARASLDGVLGAVASLIKLMSPPIEEIAMHVFGAFGSVLLDKWWMFYLVFVVTMIF